MNFKSVSIFVFLSAWQPLDAYPIVTPDYFFQEMADLTIKGKVPRVFTIDGKALAALKQKISSDPAAYEEELALLRRQASAHSTKEPWTITKKTLLPPSGDPHDYESQGPYWWPDPKSADGLPYIRRDGEKNPEIDKLSDRSYLNDMTHAVKELALAWYLTGDEIFARKASLFLRTWFIAPQTRMNPHLKYGQRIPGRTDGRDIGIIETRILGDITDAVGLLDSSSSWSKSDHEGMKQWMADYLDWLLNRSMGKARRNSATITARGMTFRSLRWLYSPVRKISPGRHSSGHVMKDCHAISNRMAGSLTKSPGRGHGATVS